MSLLPVNLLFDDETEQKLTSLGQYSVPKAFDQDWIRNFLLQAPFVPNRRELTFLVGDQNHPRL